jgi:uncharacterized damage-inducible protein DinB
VDDIRYPVGTFNPPKTALTPSEKRDLVAEIEGTPDALRKAVRGLSPAQLETPYRDGGWTVRQVAHHLPDSHLNGYVRFRLALTEDEPTIRPYAEERWAELADAKGADVALSLELLAALHRRWVLLLRELSDAQWKRKLNHPDSGIMDLERMLALYAWHGRHHVAHVTSARRRLGF